MNIVKMQAGSIQANSIEPKSSKKLEKDSIKTKDSVNISTEARALFESQQDKKINDIQHKSESGFYSKKDVIEKAVDKFLNDNK